MDNKRQTTLDEWGMTMDNTRQTTLDEWGMTLDGPAKKESVLGKLKNLLKKNTVDIKSSSETKDGEEE
jgi:hypothetical protein